MRKWLVGAATLMVVFAFVLPSAWVESAYSRGLFPWLQNAAVTVSGRIPLPLTLFVLLALPVVWPVLAVVRWRRGRRAGVRRAHLIGNGVLRFARVLLYVAATFLLMWGLGYQRTPIEQRWQLVEQDVDYGDVREVALRLLALVHRDAPEPGAALDESRAWSAIAAAERELVEQQEGWSPVLPVHIKFVPAGLLMATGTYGVCYPWILEANVDRALPVPMRLAISGHELAHVLGYCGEADANLASFVAGLRAADPLARYSTALSMLRYAMGGPSRMDNAFLANNLPVRAQQDLEALYGARRKHEVQAVTVVARKLNDTYLRTQGVELGVDDYERGFRLFVHAYRRGMVSLPEPFAAPTKRATPRDKGR